MHTPEYLAGFRAGVKAGLDHMWGIHDDMERALIDLTRYFKEEDLDALLSHDEPLEHERLGG